MLNKEVPNFVIWVQSSALLDEICIFADSAKFVFALLCYLIVNQYVIFWRFCNYTFFNLKISLLLQQLIGYVDVVRFGGEVITCIFYDMRVENLSKFLA